MYELAEQKCEWPLNPQTRVSTAVSARVSRLKVQISCCTQATVALAAAPDISCFPVWDSVNQKGVLEVVSVTSGLYCNMMNIKRLQLFKCWTFLSLPQPFIHLALIKHCLHFLSSSSESFHPEHVDVIHVFSVSPCFCQERYLLSPPAHTKLHLGLDLWSVQQPSRPATYSAMVPAFTLSRESTANAQPGNKNSPCPLELGWTDKLILQEGNTYWCWLVAMLDSLFLSHIRHASPHTHIPGAVISS